MKYITASIKMMLNPAQRNESKRKTFQQNIKERKKKKKKKKKK